jgi:hypothetical protein
VAPSPPRAVRRRPRRRRHRARIRAPCRAALRLAERWAAGATDGTPPARLQGSDSTASPHTFDSVLVDCVHPLEPEEAGGDDTARDVAFVWRDPAVALPGP